MKNNLILQYLLYVTFDRFSSVGRWWGLNEQIQVVRGRARNCKNVCSRGLVAGI